LYYSISTTGDDIDKVGRYYERFLGLRPSAMGSGGVIAGDEETAVASGSDSSRDDHEPRSVQVAVALQRTKDHVITLHLSRCKDEDATHIVVSFAQR
jgi:hypothetical protein